MQGFDEESHVFLQIFIRKIQKKIMILLWYVLFRDDYPEFRIRSKKRKKADDTHPPYNEEGQQNITEFENQL